MEPQNGVFTNLELAHNYADDAAVWHRLWDCLEWRMDNLSTMATLPRNCCLSHVRQDVSIQVASYMNSFIIKELAVMLKEAGSSLAPKLACLPFWSIT